MAKTKENKHKKKPRTADKTGRKARPVKHHQGQACGKKNCRKLLESRRWDKKLGAYVPS